MKNFFYTLLFVPIVLFGQVYNLLNLTDSLVAKYTFNGNVLDVSGNGNHATINTAELTTDRFGNLGAYEFNNSNIEIENQFFDNSWENYTISVWFLIDDLSKSMQSIFNTIPHDGEGISFNHENEPQKLSHWKTKTVGDHQWSTFGGTGNPFYDGVEENTWYFLTVVKNEFEFDYYINGNLIQTTIISESNHSGLASLRFGNIGTSSMEYLSGKIDDFSLWNRSLTQSEILDEYNAEVDCVEETIVGEYYYFHNDSTTSDYCKDISNFTYENESNELIWYFDENGTVDDGMNSPLSYNRCNDFIQISESQNTDLTILDNGWLVGCANGSIPVVLIEAGCTNEIALNYNENAYIDNNTCEFYSGPDWYVSVQGINEIGFGDEEHPFASIQYAINASNNVDKIYVQSGTYHENLNFNGKNITLIGEDKSTTIIESEDANSRIVTFNSGENTSCVLSGFTLSNSQYGAISVEGSSPTLENLIIKGNTANDGGGIYVNNSQGLTINNCELSENSSTGHGGGLSIWYDSNVYIYHSTFYNNYSATGAGIYSFNSNLEVNYSIISLNEASGDGGGITISQGQQSSGLSSSLIMQNATMYDNSAPNDSQSNGIRLAGSGSWANITNSIIWEKISGNNFSINYSNIQGQGDDNFEIYPGEGNIAQIPLFNSVDSSNPDYHLSVCSPCIDAGNPEETDPDGSTIEMGALPFITQGYNCDGNIDVEIGDEVFGGVVFYVEEGLDGQYGLVASTDYIGTGTWQQAFDQSASYENNGYTDWYLPYMHELSMIYNELHSTGSNVYNTGDVNNWYWSSEVCDSSSSASDVHFTDGSYNLCNNMSSSMGGVIAIHSFGSVAYGCIDSLAFNYSSEFANLDDGSCYPVIEGCMDTTAFNYTQTTDDVQIDVNTDDGSCVSYEEFLIDSLQLALAVFETVEDEQDYSMSFDGVDDYIDIGQSDIFEFDSSSFSVSVNFKSLSYDDSRIIGNYNGNGQYPTWNIGVSRPSGGLGHLYLDLRSPGIEFYGNIDVCDGLWHNILLVRNGNNFSVFVDGVTDINSNHILDDNDLTDNTNIIIGKANVIEQEFLNAKINNLLIFNKPLNSDYIESLQVCPPTGQEEGLVGYWKFNEGSGDTVYDMSGNGNHGVIYGAEFSEDVAEIFSGCVDENALNFDESALCDNGSCVFADDVLSNLEEELSVFETVEEEQDYSMSFDGEDDYTDINPNDDFIFENGFNISFWGKTNRDNDSESFIYFRNDILPNNPIVYVRHSEEDINIDQVYVRGTESEYYQDIELPENEWFHFSLDFNRNTNDGIDAVSIYLNGNLINQSEFDYIGELKFNDNTIETSGIHFGEAPQETWDNLKGFINSVQVWNMSIPQEQIQSYMICPPLGVEEGLVGYWNFNEGSGDTVYDISGNGNHGIIYGAEFSEDIPESYTGCSDVNALNYDESVLCDNGSCVYGDDILSNLETENSNLEEELSVFETVEEVQDFSMSFDGVNNSVIIQPSSLLDASVTNELTLSSWVKINDTTSLESILRYYPDNLNNPDSGEPNMQYSMSIDNGKIYFIAGAGNININQFEQGYSNQGTSTLSINQWLYITITYDQEYIKFYINGILDYERSIDANFDNKNGGQLFIGSDGIFEQWKLNGGIEDTEIWNKSLTQEQIQSYMSCSPTGEEEGLVGYWNFNEGSGDTVYDMSGNGNHGVIYGGAEFSEDVPESYNGCTDINALNFDESALCDNGSCVFADDVLSNFEESFNQTVSSLNNELDSTNSTLNNVIDTWQSSIDLTNATLDEVSDMNQTIASFTTLIDLQEGWNMIGYGCPEPVNIEQGMSMYTDLVLLIKDNNGSVYLPEFNFNGIGDFTPGYGYQLKVSESIEDFGLCGDYTNTESPEITDIETDNAQMQNDINCLTGNPQIGDHCYGGIVFYVEEGEQGKYGLVATTEIVGTGTYYDAIELSDNYEYEGYDDWRLPSLDELYIIYSQIYSSGLISYITGDIYNWYWALNECEDTTSPAASDIHFTDGFIAECNNADSNPGGIIAIRSFGNVNYGCMDSLACNYNPEANMADDSCTYLEQGYDCEGNLVCYYPEDEVFMNWLQHNYPSYLIDSACIDIESASSYTGQVIIGPVSNMQNIDGVQYFNNISYLEINGLSQLIEIPDISGLTNLNTFTLHSNNALISLPDLSGLSNLSEFQTHNNGSLTSLPGLAELTNLERLTISSNSNLDTIIDISLLTNLTFLYVGGNDLLTTLPLMSGLTNLTHLDIDNNDGLTEIPDLSNLINLDYLRISYNDSLTIIPNLSSLTNLTNLEISYNSALECVISYPEQLAIQEQWPPVCEEEVTYQVGDLAEGGIVFYVDETGQHGLVAALEDIGEFEWGCYGTSITGAEGQAIGTGYQNTLDIVAGCSETPIAASEALAYESDGFSDWYLPSNDELYEMYNTIGNGGPEGSIGGFENDWYWSSSEASDNSAWDVNFLDGSRFYGFNNKLNTYRVRVIRAF